MGLFSDLLMSLTTPEARQVSQMRRQDYTNELLKKKIELLEKKEAEEARQKRIEFFGEDPVEVRKKKDEQEEIKKFNEECSTAFALLLIGLPILYILSIVLK